MNVNAEEQTTRVAFDAELGVLTKRTDPNGLVTAWEHDGFGHVGLVVQPDGARTAVTLSRSKDGGPNRDAWRVRQRSATTGGADDTVAQRDLQTLDSLKNDFGMFTPGKIAAYKTPRNPSTVDGLVEITRQLYSEDPDPPKDANFMKNIQGQLWDLRTRDLMDDFGA